MRKSLCLLLMLMLVFVSGCGVMDWIFPDKDDVPEPDDDFIELPGDDSETTGDGRLTLLYVADTHGRYVMPVTYDMPWEEGIAKAAVRHLVEGGPAHEFLTTNGLRAVLPAGTKILGMTVKEDGECIIDFSREFLMAADEIHEQLILDSITFTLTEFSTIDRVTIWVEGEPLTRMNHGTSVETLSRALGINASASPKGTGTAVTVYMRMDSLAGGTFLVPVTRPVATVSDLAVAALEQLIGGPGDVTGLSAVMPVTTRIQKLSLEGSTVTVDFSDDLAATEDLDVTVAAIVLTLTDLPNIDEVMLTIGGQNIQLASGRILSEPVFRPSSTNPLAF